MPSLHVVAYYRRTVAVIVPHAHWEAYRRGSLPLHNLVPDSANPHCVSDPLAHPLWDHRSTGQLCTLILRDHLEYCELSRLRQLILV